MTVSPGAQRNPLLEASRREQQAPGYSKMAGIPGNDALSQSQSFVFVEIAPRKTRCCSLSRTHARSPHGQTLCMDVTAAPVGACALCRLRTGICLQWADRKGAGMRSGVACFHTHILNLPACATSDADTAEHPRSAPAVL